MTFRIVRISSKGQIVIPQEIREKMKIKEGDSFVIFPLSDDILVLRRLIFNDEEYRVFKKELINALRELDVDVDEKVIDKAFDLVLKKYYEKNNSA